MNHTDFYKHEQTVSASIICHDGDALGKWLALRYRPRSQVIGVALSMEQEAVICGKVTHCQVQLILTTGGQNSPEEQILTWVKKSTLEQVEDSPSRTGVITLWVRTPNTVDGVFINNKSK